MKEIIIKYYQTKSMDMNEAIQLMEEYMKAIGKYKPEIIQNILDPMNPFGQQMLQTAVQVSIEYIESNLVTITKVWSKDKQQILMVF